MKNRILFQYLNLAVIGLGVAAFAACAAGTEVGESGGRNDSSTTGSGTTETSTTGSLTTGSQTTDPDPAGGSTSAGGGGAPASTSTGSTMSSTGSSSGEGGSGVGPTDVTMIDDMEDGNNAILRDGGRQGYWYTFNDQTEGGTQTPAMGDDFTMTTLTPPRGASMVAASMRGEGFTEWGAGMGFDLNSTDTGKSTYDASAFKGITFWAKATAASSKTLKVLLADVNTTPPAEGGACEKDCNIHFARTVALSEEWKKFDVSFATPLDATKLLSIQFQTAVGDAFEVYVDDVAFYK